MGTTKVQRRFRAATRKPAPKWSLAALAVATFAGVVVVGLSASAPTKIDLRQLRNRIEYQAIRVIDGDTIVVATGERVRILNIESPDMPPHSRCAEEERLALASRERLRRLIRAADDVTMRFGHDGRDHDSCGRSLRYVFIDGRDAGETLITAGLARPWCGSHAKWC